MIETKTSEDSKAEKSLPIARIRTIMKSSMDVLTIRDETLHVVCVAAVCIFIIILALNLNKKMMSFRKC